MLIRAARIETTEDIEAILSIDHSYHTDYSWQMHLRNELSPSLEVSFQLVRLPRPAHVPSPHSPLALRRVLDRCDFIWVAQDERSGCLQGYVAVAVVPWQNTAWVPLLAVAPAMRRRGIGRRLLQTAIARAREQRLHSLTIEVSSKNYPATCLARAMGMRFCGYADNYYNGTDIVLFFTYRIGAR